jgi:hypothetical protein
LVDNDLNGDNGFVASTTGTCGTATAVNYSISDVPAGTYYIYAGVRVISAPNTAPQSGDYLGFYGGSLTNPPAQPNAEVPASGTVNFDIVLEIL